ncbi:hypothetical protein B484DRAFT_393180 [Ochromonadaceae sp. CCMP2298]|nr:hypothetical protein B484DRAFT_393180 [Ochromonadaceae sp. CCMP2298]
MYMYICLLNAIPRFPWSPEGRAQGRVYCGMLSLLCTLAQRRLPYHIKDVQSNDELYSGAEYSRELGESVDGCVGMVLKHLTQLGEKGGAGAGGGAGEGGRLAQARGAIDLADQLCARMAFTPPAAALCLKLMGLAHR